MMLCLHIGQKSISVCIIFGYVDNVGVQKRILIRLFYVFNRLYILYIEDG